MTRTHRLVGAIIGLAAMCAASLPALAQEVLRGHGGPVRALAVRGEARELISGSFDSTVIVWDLVRNTAKRVLRFHDGPVNAVGLLSDGCFASGGEDARVAVWCGDDARPAVVLPTHKAPVSAVIRRNEELVTGSFDGSTTVWRWLPSGKGMGGRTTESRTPITALAFVAGRHDLITATAEGSLSSTPEGGAPTRIALGASITAIAASPDGEIVAVGGDGVVRFISAQLMPVAELELDGTPLASLVLSPDGKLIATAGLRGGIAVIDRASRKIVHRLTGPGLPVWSLAFDTDSRTLFSGGADRVIRRWDAIAGTAISGTLPERDMVAEAVASGERGARVFRACQACHTLSPDGGNRAGPTLHGIFGRRIGSAAGYLYSEALSRLDIVWSKETISRLFEIGPAAYTPGTKMPEQTITDPADRLALVEWLERVTASR